MTLGQCDSITCCWLELVSLVWKFLKYAWPAFAAYGVLYTIGALITLFSLKLNADPETGRLVVNRDSWLYLFAHPNRYGKIKAYKAEESWFQPTSICVIYARAFNMLLFFWPIMFLFCVATYIGGNIFGVLFQGYYVVFDISETVFLRWKQFSWTPTIIFTGPAILLVLAAINIRALLHAMAKIGWIGLCLAPVIVIVGIVAFVSVRYARDYDIEGTTANVFQEALSSKKERFCKIVNIK